MRNLAIENDPMINNPHVVRRNQEWGPNLSENCKRGLVGIVCFFSGIGCWFFINSLTNNSKADLLPPEELDHLLNITMGRF